MSIRGRRALTAYIGPLDAAREGLILAPSKRAVAQLLGINIYKAEKLWRVHGRPELRPLDMVPGVLYVRPHGEETWRCGQPGESR